MNNKESIQNLIDSLEELVFDSIVFILGINEAEYLDELKKRICVENKVLIIEPNNDKYNAYKDFINDERIMLFPYDEVLISNTVNSLITYQNFNRLRVHAYGDYIEKYNDEYTHLIKVIDTAYFSALSELNLSYGFKTLFLDNIISNLDKIPNSTPLNSYIDYNKNVPAIIVSAGPSLDKNIEAMVKYKEKLKDFFIIAGNRTLGSLIKNGIIPNLVVSVDPQDVTYEMIEKYIDYKIPLVYYEGSNKTLIQEYKGDLIYTAFLLPKTIESMKDCLVAYSGGSVAHTCTDIARIMGCNPIIFTGQDFAYTFDKHHSDISTYNIDANEKISNFIPVKDVYGNDIYTTLILNLYKDILEDYIKIIKRKYEIDFYNTSYGADIIGAPHIELEEILKTFTFTNKSKNLIPDKCLNINPKSIINFIHESIDNFIIKSEECIDLCQELLSKQIEVPMVEMKEDDENLQKFIHVFSTVTEFEESKLSVYIWGYKKQLIFEIRDTYFDITAKDYPNLTSDIKFQSNNFMNYFITLKSMLEEIKKMLKNFEQN